MDQSTEVLTQEIDQHRRAIEDRVREIEERISPRQVTQRWRDSARRVVEELRVEGIDSSETYQGIYADGGPPPRDATLVARGMIRRRPILTAGMALAGGFILGGIGR